MVWVAGRASKSQIGKAVHRRGGKSILDPRLNLRVMARGVFCVSALGMTAGGIMMAAAREEIGAAMPIHK
jgi:hypothetical protein